ncbi:MAG: glycosyltransferase family 1 protein [Clostridia bacterium]|nr:MAG: glycosyltransferase family 1 protein [Clostridia bacterium]
MKIAIDYTPAALQGAGIGRYTRGLVDALMPLLGPGDELTLLYPRGDSPFARKDWPGKVDIRHLPLPDRYQTILWHRLRLPLPIEWLVGDVDIFHAPNFLLPPARRAKTLLTIHDLAFLVRPEYAWPDLRRFLEKAVPRSVARAHHILADSEASKQDAMRLFGLPSARVTVVGAGVDSRFRPMPPEETAGVRAKYGLEWPFVFSISTLEPRKNFDGLVRAFARARREANLPHHLVIAGGKGWMYEQIFAAVAEEGAGDFVHFPGFVPDSDLPALYNLAELFAFPSHYEGFGLPLLEALASGTPALATNVSSLPEIAGDAAWLVPADDPEALVAGLTHLLTDAGARAELRARGPGQAARFTWDAAARRLMDTYRALAG